LRGTFRVGRIGGVAIGIHWSLAAIGAVLAFELVENRFRPAYPGLVNGVYWLVAAGTVLLFFAAILAHELGHAVAARRQGIKVESIELWILGGLTHLDREATTARGDGVIAVCGPLASLACAALFAGASIGADRAGLHSMVTSALAWLAFVNLILAGFNLLPATPLDGGRILRAVLWSRNGDPDRAAIATAKTGRVLALVIIAGGAVLAFNGQPALFTVLIGWFILSSSKMSQQIHTVRASLTGRPVSDVTWFGVAHAADWMSVGSMLDQQARMGSAGVVAVEGFGGGLRGLVTLGQLRAVPEAVRWSTHLAELTIPFDRLGRAGLQDDTMAALSTSPGPILTVWDRDQLVGVVTPEQIRHLSRS
jgi:Zn-dependent protease